jgi:negative regulator of sigma-B (phosphoserine phosphatase)
MIAGLGRLTDAHGRHLVTWGSAGVALRDETESGDLYIVQEYNDGVLIGAIDGAGHGAEAASAARLALATLTEHVYESPISLMLRCHAALKGTRGAVMTLACCHLHDWTVTWLGVGNVDAVLFHGQVGDAPARVVLRGGVVGYQLPPLRAEVLPLRPFDTLVMTTDGIEEHFADALSLEGTPQQIAERILNRHRKGTDDALVLVVRIAEGERS